MFKQFATTTTRTGRKAAGLNRVGFAACLTKGLGVTLNARDGAHAYESIDVDMDGTISEQEFLSWFLDWQGQSS